MRRLVGAIAPLGLAMLLAAGCNSERDVSLDAVHVTGSPGISQGPVSGGTPVTIRGRHFPHEVTLTFGGIDVINAQVISSVAITGFAPPATFPGPVKVEIRTRRGNDRLDGGWTYIPDILTINPSPNPNGPPGITPVLGDVTGGTFVTVTGSGFIPPDPTGAGGTRVGFGNTGNTLPSWQVVDSSTIQGFTPPSPTGTDAVVDVIVFDATNPGNQAILPNAFEYRACLGITTVTLTSVNPPLGPVQGGTRVTVTGTNLIDGTAVLFDGKPGGNPDYSQAPCAVIVNTPPGQAPVPVDVIVRNTDGAATAQGAFTYTSVSITAIAPDQGPISGGTTVVVSGSGFLDPTDITFGGALGTNGTFVDFSTYIVDTPPAPTLLPGFVDVVIANPAGTAALVAGFEYLPVSFDSIVPNFDTLAGGASVAITGTGLGNMQRVLLGANELINAQSDLGGTRITGTAPPGSAPGPVDVTIVTSSFGDVILSNAFVYDPGPPVVCEITPNFGSLAGGDIVLITGENFTSQPLPLRIAFDSLAPAAPALVCSQNAVPWDIAACPLTGLIVDAVNPGDITILNTQTIRLVVPQKPDGILAVVAVGAENGVGCTSTPEAFAYAEWRSPGPIGGFVTDIEIHPTNTSIVYVAISGLGAGGTGGLFRSDDDGLTWSRRDGTLPDSNINDLALAGGLPTTLYAGTPSGLFMSDNEGISWVPVQDPDLSSNPVDSLAVHPTVASTFWAGSERSTVFASIDGGTTSTAQVLGAGIFEVTALARASNGNLFAGTGGDGVYLSAGGGGTWASVTNNLGNTFILSLAVDPGNALRVYAGTVGDGVYRTDDSGGTWNRLGDMLPAVTPSVYALAHGAATGQLYAAVDDVGGVASGVWYATLAHTASPGWNEESGTTPATSLEFSGAEAEIRSLAREPGAAPDTVYAGAIGGVFKTTNGGVGTDWSRTDDGISNTNVQGFVRTATNNTTFAGTFGAGVYNHPNVLDPLQLWTISNGAPRSLFATRVQAMAFAPNQGLQGTLYAGTSDDGVWMSLDMGLTWTRENIGLDTPPFPLDPLDARDIRSVAIDPAADALVYVATNGAGVWGTGAGGTPGLSWNHLPGDPLNGLLTETKIRDVTVSTTIQRRRGLNPDPAQTPYPIQIVMAGTDEGGAFASTNGGSSWLEVNGGFVNLDVRDITVGVERVVDPEQSSNPARFTDNFFLIAGTGGGGVHRGTTAISINQVPGVTPPLYNADLDSIGWIPLNNGLDDRATFPNAMFVNAVAMDPNMLSNIFAGTDGDGVFLTGNGGVKWRQLDPGAMLTNPIINDLGLVFDDLGPPLPPGSCANCTTILAGTAGGGSNQIRILKQKQ